MSETETRSEISEFDGFVPIKIKIIKNEKQQEKGKKISDLCSFEATLKYSSFCVFTFHIWQMQFQSSRFRNLSDPRHQDMSLKLYSFFFAFKNYNDTCH